MIRRLVLFASVLLLLSPSLAADIVVKPGESIQKAIDAAPDGAVIALEAGTYAERISITKPLTLKGAGGDKTILHPTDTAQRSDAEKLRFVGSLESAKDDQERLRLMMTYFHRLGEPTIRVASTRDVTLSGLKVQGPAPASVEGLSHIPLIHFDDVRALVSDCAVVGPFMNGIAVTNGSDVQIKSTLVAGIWNTGVAVFASEQRGGGKPARVRISDSDIRNCYHRCVTISGEGSIVERSRISGSAWHGIRYDHCSPTIENNLIFRNARCGIYASGNTAATVRGNVFFRNEMDGISCWFNNADTIEGNTFVNNLREGIAVLGNSKPKILKNVIAGNPIGIACNQINEKSGPAGDPQPNIQENVFWKNATAVKRLQEDQSIPEGNRDAEVNFADEAGNDFTLAADVGVGAAKPIALKSPWSVQPEEKAIIPDTETRDSRSWKKPGMQR